MHMNTEDQMIMNESAMVEKDTAYPRYIKNRFLVLEINDMPDGLCALIADKEIGYTEKYYEGDELADGKIESIDKDGMVTYQPNMAAVTPFVLPSEIEMSPMQGDKKSKTREKKDDKLRADYNSKGAVLIVKIDDKMDREAVY